MKIRMRHFTHVLELKDFFSSSRKIFPTNRGRFGRISVRSGRLKWPGSFWPNFQGEWFPYNMDGSFWPSFKGGLFRPD